MNFSKIKTLLLFAQYTEKLSYYDDWRDAFLREPEFEITSINICDKKNIRIVFKIIKEYDFVVLLHSASADTLSYLSPFKNALCKRKGRLLTFVGNEVNLPGLSMSEKINFIRDIDAEFIGTQLPIEAGEWLFKECKKSTVVSLPHALNPERFYPIVPQSQRRTDIGTRTHKYSPLLGDNDRNSIIEYFIRKEFRPPIVVDIETEVSKRFNKDDWPMFLNSCRGTIATEAGSFFLEKDDATVMKIADHVRSRCGAAQRSYMKLDIRRYSRLIPDFIKPYLITLLRYAGVKSHDPCAIYSSVSFEEIHELFYRNYRNPLSGKCISSRHFDAIGTKTCQIMFPGKFNGILEVDRHYIALMRDFSNINDVLEKFRDYKFRNNMVDETYDYIMSCHTYKHRLADIRDLIEKS